MEISYELYPQTIYAVAYNGTLNIKPLAKFVQPAPPPNFTSLLAKFVQIFKNCV
jgi:hypothetical protein